MPFRVVTTTYIGGTERERLDRLVREFGAEVKIQYDAAAHPAARQGVAVPSQHRLRHRLCRLLQPLHERAPRRCRVERAAFERRHSRPDGEVPGDLRLLLEQQRVRALRPRRGTATGSTTRCSRRRAPRLTIGSTISLSGLEVRPYPYQQEMLDALEVEREVHDRHRNLVVAATGTGKTVDRGPRLPAPLRADGRQRLSAAVRRAPQRDPRAVPADLPRGAGRRELRRALRRRRAPERWKHVFASVQSLTSYGVDNIPRTPSTSWSSTSSITPRRRPTDDPRPPTPAELLGLTATPERADGMMSVSFFDGRTAAELACGMPSEQISCARSTTSPSPTALTCARITWSRGRVRRGRASNVFTGNDARAASS